MSGPPRGSPWGRGTSRTQDLKYVAARVLIPTAKLCRRCWIRLLAIALLGEHRWMVNGSLLHISLWVRWHVRSIFGKTITAAEHGRVSGESVALESAYRQGTRQSSIRFLCAPPSQFSFLRSKRDIAHTMPKPLEDILFVLIFTSSEMQPPILEILSLQSPRHQANPLVYLSGDPLFFADIVILPSHEHLSHCDCESWLSPCPPPHGNI